MTHVLAGFETWERTFVIADDEQCVFGIGGRDVELAEHIRLDADGRVSEIRLCGRPLSGIAALAAAAAPPLAAHHSPNRGRLVGLLSRGLPGLLAGGDRLVNRLARRPLDLLVGDDLEHKGSLERHTTRSAK